MKIAFFGLPQTGKSMVFELLTGIASSVTKFDSSGIPQPAIGIAVVPDPALDFIHSYHPGSKKVNSQIEYMDIAGLKFGDIRENRLLAYLREVDVLAHVVRDFKTDAVFHSAGEINPLRDVKKMEEELILSDLIIAENRIDRLKKTVMKTSNQDDQLQLATLEKIKPILEKGQPLREVDLKQDEEKSIRNFGFLSQKPLQIIFNLDESDIPGRHEHVRETLSEFFNKRNVIVSHICATIELEISRMQPDEAEEFKNDYGLQYLGADRLIKSSFDLLGLIRFLTIGHDECRSWEIKAGTTAYLAAGRIHTDIQRGFIAAQVIKFKDYRESPNLQQLKQKGLIHVEGKEYIVSDEDIIEFRFNV